MAQRPKAFFLNDTRSEMHHGCSTVVETVLALCKRAGVEIVGAAPVHRDWRKDAASMAAFDSADLVIVNGEGTIHHDRQAGEWLLAAGPEARKRGKKSALVNATWEANSQRLADMAAQFDIVSVREGASQRELSAAGVECRRIADLALYHQPAEAPRRRGAAYTDSVIGPLALELYARMRRLGGRPVNLLYGHGSLRGYLGLARRFVPGSDIYNPLKIAGALRAALLDLRSQTPDRDEFARQVASCEVMVTGRFHMLIYALSTRTPFLALESNTRKISSTVADAGLGAWRMVEVKDIDTGLLQRASAWRGGEREALEAYIASSRAAMEALFDDIRKLV